jgi:hypothetical protein
MSGNSSFRITCSCSSSGKVRRDAADAMLVWSMSIGIIGVGWIVVGDIYAQATTLKHSRSGGMHGERSI